MRHCEERVRKGEGRFVGNRGRTGSHEKGRKMGGVKVEDFLPPRRSHLLPTGVEKVSQPHDVAVVQLPHNLQLSVLRGKGREPQKTTSSLCLPFLVLLTTALLPYSSQQSQAATPCVPAPRPPWSSLIPHPNLSPSHKSWRPTC